jgi:hypothetical protein
MEYTEEKEPPDVLTSDTDNATKIEPKDAPPHKKFKFRRFRAYNTGTWNGPKRQNKEVVRRQDNLHRYDSIASSLLINDFQKSKGRKMLDSLDIMRFGVDVDTIIFAICVIVANDDVHDGSRYYPHPTAEGDQEFVDVAESLNLDRAKQVSIVEKVRSAIRGD